MSIDVFEPLRVLPFDVCAIVVDDIDAVAAYSDPHTVYEWASVTKLLASYGVLVAVGRGLVSLDDPAGPEGSTLRHLLAHASGLRMKKTDTLAPVGSRRIYSNRGIEVAADHVAQRLGVDFHEWVGNEILDPLDMDTVEFYGSPAWGARGSSIDLAKFVRALLGGLLIPPALFKESTSPVFPDLVGVTPGFGIQDPNSWGLGFEIRSHKSPHWTGHNNSPETFGHFGVSGSFCWVDPRRRIGVAFLGAEPVSDTHKEIWPDLSDRILAQFTPML